MTRTSCGVSSMGMLYLCCCNAHYLIAGAYRISTMVSQGRLDEGDETDVGEMGKAMELSMPGCGQFSTTSIKN